MENLGNALKNMGSLISLTNQALEHGCLMMKLGEKPTQRIEHSISSITIDNNRAGSSTINNTIMDDVVCSRASYTEGLVKKSSNVKSVKKMVRKQYQDRDVYREQSDYDIERKVWRDFYRANSL